MSQSGKSSGGAISRGLYAALCAATILFVMEAPGAGAVRADASCAPGSHQRSGAVLEPAARVRSPCASTLFCRCAIRQGWIDSCRRSTILPAPPTAISLRCRSLPRGLVPARKIMTPWFSFATSQRL